MIKKLIKFILVVLLILAIGIFLIGKFYSGDPNFLRLLEKEWVGKIGENEFTVKFFKGSKEVKEYTYGYIEVYKKDKLLTREHIKYKDKKIVSVDQENLTIDLEVDFEKEVISGKMKSKEIQGEVLLKGK